MSPDLRDLWGKLEEKVSLKTKSHSEALRRAAVVNTQFDEKAVQLRQQLSGRKLPNRQVMEAAREILVKEGIHPQQLLDLSRFSAAPRARLSHLSFESDRAFPAQC